MAVFGQFQVLLPLLLTAVSCWPHPYPWLQTIMRNPPAPQFIGDYSSLEFQNNPFLAGIFQNPSVLVPDTNYIIGQLPFNIDGHQAFINDPYFLGYGPQQIDWNIVPEVPYDPGFGSICTEEPVDHDDKHNKEGGGHSQGDPNNPPHDKDPLVNESKNPGAGETKPNDEDEEFAIDPRRDEAKYSKPH